MTGIPQQQCGDVWLSGEGRRSRGSVWLCRSLHGTSGQLSSSLLQLEKRLIMAYGREALHPLGDSPSGLLVLRWHLASCRRLDLRERGSLREGSSGLQCPLCADLKPTSAHKIIT